MSLSLLRTPSICSFVLSVYNRLRLFLMNNVDKSSFTMPFFPNGTTTYHYHRLRAYGHCYPLGDRMRSSSPCYPLVYCCHNCFDPYPDRNRKLRHPLDSHYYLDQTPHIELQTVTLAMGF